MSNSRIEARLPTQRSPVPRHLSLRGGCERRPRRKAHFDWLSIDEYVDPVQTRAWAPRRVTAGWTVRALDRLDRDMNALAVREYGPDLSAGERPANKFATYPFDESESVA